MRGGGVLRGLAARARAAAPRDDVASRRASASSGLDPRPDSFALHRIIGNDLEPRHRKGQSRENLRFILENEPPLEACEKRWIVNRIVDAEEERAILALLEAHGQRWIRIPFDPEAYRRIGWDTGCLPHPEYPRSRAFRRLDPEARQRLRLAQRRLKINYVMNNNGARNAALREGRSLAKWALPWDGNCFVTARAWEDIRASVAARPHLRYFVVPMARIADNADLLRDDFSPNPVEEPQILFRCDAAEEFDAERPYGRRPKVELFWRLGVPGKWDRWRDDPWDPPRRARAAEAGQFATVGWVARLSSGRNDLEREGRAGFLSRGLARQQAILATLNAVDDALENPDADPGGLLHYGTGALDALRDRCGIPMKESGLASVILGDAEAASGRGPFSVADKTSLPPSGERRDYWHPAPYWWPNPWIPGGRPYLRRDGRRVPGTRMHEPDSDQYDRSRLQRLFDDTAALALAWRLTDRPDFATRAARNVETWFVTPETRMNPHLRYSQVRRGWNRDEGVGTGIIEFKDFYYFLDAVRILESGGVLPPSVGAGLSAWLREYLGWLLDSRQGAHERAATNNHGTYYDLQVSAVAARLGERDVLRETLLRAQARVAAQMTPSGEQPEEMSRRTKAHYCLFNLQGWMNLIRVGRRTGMLRPDFDVEPWTRVRAAVLWVLERDMAACSGESFDVDRMAPLAAQARENGIILPASGRRGSMPARPVFDPHDGIAPYWPLGVPDPDAANGS
jgi:hypothetical protein